jgi:hypothetical protein
LLALQLKGTIMADLKISQLTGATTPLAGTEVVPLVQSGTTKKVSVADLTAGRDVAMLSATAGNIKASANKIESTNTNGDIDIDPNGTGRIVLNATTQRTAIGGKIDMVVSLSQSQTRTITISCNIALASFLEISVAGMVAAGLGQGRAKFIVGGDLRSTATYGITELARTNVTNLTISALTAGNGSITFTIANASAVQNGQGIVSIEYVNGNNGEITMSVV